MGCGVEASLTITSGVTLPYNIVVPQSKCAVAGRAGDKTEPFSFAEVEEMFVAAFVVVVGCPIVDGGARRNAAMRTMRKTDSRMGFIEIPNKVWRTWYHVRTSTRISYDA